MRLNPLTVKKIQRFRSIKRGYYSLLLVIGLLVFAAIAELFINNRALIVSYEGSWRFPTYGAMIPGTEFGLDYSHETNYRELREIFREEGAGNWVIMPIVPWSPVENAFRGESMIPRPPDFARRHFLGTDRENRDILSRLVYGFRNAMIFAFGFMFFVYLIGTTLGCLMGYFGGTFDLIVQRFIEIWSNVPFLYVVIIVASVVTPTLGILLAITVLFAWTGMTYYMRTNTLKEKARDYTAAAQVLGASTPRIIFLHILPNTIATLVTFMPFTMASAITAITALDFLGFGLPRPTPSWGEMLQQGTQTMVIAPWIVTSAFSAIVIVLILITFVGEAVREAFDPKKFTVYE
ncbi:MAG: ABC transporter permease subunit [Opitutales bacterium]|nr:ABC transporter permease subunit [Opitutales bacterium]